MKRTFQHFDYEELSGLKRYYEPEEYFYEPFYKLQAQLASLQRFFM
jgi:hypothetical protein